MRCSTWAREVEVSPIATVGSYSGYLLVEVPLPWPRDIGELATIDPLHELVNSVGVRVQAVIATGDVASAEPHRVIFYGPSIAESGFRSYGRQEMVLNTSIVESVNRLLSSRGDQSTRRDVLVCTHGRRDVCCGTGGTELALRLAGMKAREDVHIWRSSHTGGHRFAPTFIVLPEGTGWAFADVDLVGRVLDRTAPFAQVAGHYRGCAGLPGPQVQVLEREVLKEVGWELLDRSRSGHLTGEVTSDGGLVVRLEAGSDRWEGVARRGRTLPVPECRKPLSTSKKVETEWIVDDLRHIP